MDLVYRLDKVSYSYGASKALDEVSFSVSRGGSLAILGSNGSGKSTLLKIMNGLIFPSAGTIEFAGATLDESGLTGGLLRCFRERVGFVFSEPDVQLFCPTVFDELAFGPLQLELSEKEVKERVHELLDMLGISALSERPPYTLSTGEKKKVAIASVLSTNPDVLLMDEPTNGLDPRTQVWLFELLRELKTLEKTCVMATHDLSLAEDLADRAIVLDETHGKAADGAISDVLRDRDMLLKANIIHEHSHRHGHVVHSHTHSPFASHDEHLPFLKER
ncbi:MAG: ABC transporter ATP-binding protein [Deltaproteobacteria bacterium]|nr:ABC transporter ATP-binding protein [Deltaproteobacteria bacterium]